MNSLKFNLISQHVRSCISPSPTEAHFNHAPILKAIKERQHAKDLADAVFNPNAFIIIGNFATHGRAPIRAQIIAPQLSTIII